LKNTHGNINSLYTTKEAKTGQSE